MPCIPKCRCYSVEFVATLKACISPFLCVRFNILCFRILFQDRKSDFYILESLFSALSISHCTPCDLGACLLSNLVKDTSIRALLWKWIFMGVTVWMLPLIKRPNDHNILVSTPEGGEQKQLTRAWLSTFSYLFIRLFVHFTIFAAFTSAVK